MSKIVYYYIDGELVSEKKAYSYYNEGALRSLESGYIDGADIQTAWDSRLKSEEAREAIFNYSAIQDEGGLEIVIEYD